MDINEHQLSALLMTGIVENGNHILCTKDTFIWSSLICDLLNTIEDLTEETIKDAMDYAFSIYSRRQKELLDSGLDFISYLNNRHVPLKDLIIEFVDYIFKHCKEDNNEHYLSYVYNIIGFIEDSFIKSNEALNNLILHGYLEETYSPLGSLFIDLVPTSFFSLTPKGKELLNEINNTPKGSLPPTRAKLLTMEPLAKKINRAFYRPGTSA